VLCGTAAQGMRNADFGERRWGEVRILGILRSSHTRSSKKFGAFLVL
jgi:hypothetical protein